MVRNCKEVERSLTIELKERTRSLGVLGASNCAVSYDLGLTIFMRKVIKKI